MSSGPGPIVEQAVDGGTNTVVVTFDEALVAGALNAANWTGTFGGSEFAATAAVAAGTDVTLTVPPAGPRVPGDEVSYAASPADVVSLATGNPAAAFTDEPILAGG